ncbi:glycosyltransferase family 4 protein [Rubinisphaera italica]|uniref:GDP-mannose-dependent alpha-mannosyltransferase n=1 Tax=Rubinisphaera italica TaxID=2527969 RepID=A0A5C5XBE5_9PLAN|nr:glycosyltransferase family 4 protein [Rubinisphaera italica]TWT59959.1 GDP-mannose-dependent alpha-mannosyltransferase [Rubinisphaera italica]
MKIAHIITRMIIGGAQQNTLHTIEDHLREHGDDVTLFTGPTTGPEGSLMDLVHASGCRVIEIPSLLRKLQTLHELAALRQIKSALRELQPDIVHTHSSKAGIIGRKAAYDLKLPCVHTIHGAAFHYGQNKILYRVYRKAEKIAQKWTDHYISVADAMSQQYLDAGIGKPEQYTTISSGFDVEPFLQEPTERASLRKEWGLSDEHILIGKIGRLFPLKGHDAIIAVAAEVIRQAPQVRFLFIGDGILREQYLNEIRDQGLQDHFIFTGLVDPTEIPRLMQATDIVAHTSQWEGLARVLPQALISGKPVVSFDIDGAREVTIPNETGCLIPRNDLTGLTQALVQLANDEEMRTRFGKNGRERFTDQFRHQTMSRRIREVYEKVLARRN